MLPCADKRVPILDVCIAYERSLNKSGKVDKTLAKLTREIAYA